jgi:hypothetical protein
MSMPALTSRWLNTSKSASNTLVASGAVKPPLAITAQPGAERTAHSRCGDYKTPFFVAGAEEVFAAGSESTNNGE